MSTHTLHFQPNPASPPRTRLARLGDWMARHRSSIACLQWAIVVLYFVLVAVPAFLPLPPEDARMFDNFTRLARRLTPHYRVLVPDLPGFGDSSPRKMDGSYAMDDQVRRLRALLDQLEPLRAVNR